MDLAGKLQLKAGQSMAVLHAPTDVELGIPADTPAAAPAEADAVILFAVTAADLAKRKAPAVAAARRDALTWIAYPKAKKLGTDLNRDLVCQHLLADGIQPVRQVAIDDTWSALRFRPA